MNSSANNTASRREWHGRVWRLAAPIILSNLSIPLVGAVDTAVVGHLPDPAYIGAVALGAVVFSFLYWGFGFLRMGTTGFVAQAYGAGELDEMRSSIARALLLAVLLGSVVVALQWPIGHAALWALDADPQIESLTEDYYRIRVWSAPGALLQYVVLGSLIGLQNTRAVLVLQLVLNGTNVVLDLVFVVGFGWDVKGVAAATLISECLAAGVGLWLLQRSLRPLGGRYDRTTLLDRVQLTSLLRVNGNIFIRTLCLISAFAYFTALGSSLGALTLAANAVLMHLQQFLAYGLDGFAHAAETLAGSAYGRRDRSAFRAAVRTATIWAAAVALVYTALYAIAGTGFIALLTNIESVRAEAQRYLPWLIAAPIISVWSFQLDGIFIGTTHTREMRNGMIISLIVFAAATWSLMSLFGNHGLWAALMIFMIARALTLGWWFRRIDLALQ